MDSWTILLCVLLYFSELNAITDPRCPAPYGLFADSVSCERYISCWGGRGFSLTCGPGRVFNPATSSCQEGAECPRIQHGAPPSGGIVRLTHSRQQGAGQVQILSPVGWAQVTASSFNDDIASLVCLRLGYERFSTWFSSLPPTQNAIFTHIVCASGSRSLKECSPRICSECEGREPIVAIKCEVPSSSRCPSSSSLWQRWGDSCYLAKDDLAMSREEAYGLCKALNANLISIDEQMEHEFISSMLRSSEATSEFYTDGAGVVLAGGGIMWAWQATRLPLKYQKWWPGWNATGRLVTPTLPSPTPSPACVIMKKSYPLRSKRQNTKIPLQSSELNLNSYPEYDSGFYFFDVADCSQKRSFICEAGLVDFGCRDGTGLAYSGSANVTISGNTCLNWVNPEINNLLGRAAHARASSTTFNLSLLGDHSYCRNPNNSTRPWCFVGPEKTEECDIPFCDRTGIADIIGRNEDFSLISNPVILFPSSNNSPGSRTSERNKLKPDDDMATILEVHPSLRKPIIADVSGRSKVRCKEDEYHCARSDLCVKELQVCDGTRQCPEGDDERSCKKFLSSLEVSKRMTLIIRNLIQTLYREDIGVCAKKCLDDSRCKGIVYNEQKQECGLSRLSIGESGLVPSTREDFFEVRSRKRFCGTKFTCSNGRCIPKSSVCNGRNDCIDNSDEAKCLTPLNHRIRLTGGIETYEGNVQINIQNQWGYICDDEFGWNEADVVCKELGFSGAAKFTRNNAFGKKTQSWLRSTPRFWLSGLQCTGLESSITNCPSTGLGHHDCGPTEISGVICRRDNDGCSSEQFQCKEKRTCVPRTHVCNGIMNCPDLSDESPDLCEDLGVVRLLSTKGSPGNAVGTVHVKHNGAWGTVCDDAFDEKHAQVVCRSLGYDTEWATPYPKTHFGRGAGVILIDEPGCKGTELHLSDCPTHTWGPGNCDHSEDVGVFCSDQEKIRLVDGGTPHEGRVEILLSGEWGTICDDDFDDYDAKVICRMLGYKGGGIAHKKAFFGKGSGPVWLDNVDCLGNETTLNECKRSPPGTSACSHAEDAAVTCFVTEPRSFDRSLHRKLPSTCGQRLSSFAHIVYDSIAKILGGRTIHRLDSPWLVSLQLRENGVQKHNCGGVVISEDHIITAAHCFRAHSKDAYVARVGDFDLLSKELSQEDFLIEKLYVHDDFDNKVEFNNDIALLKIGRKNGRGIRLGGSVQPICLPTVDANYFNVTDCKISGWGTTSERAKPIPQRRPRAGYVDIFPMRTCIGSNKYGAHEITSGMICAGQLDGSVDTCTGDSGGPLTCLVDGQHVLYGITSWGKGCGRRGQPGMYTKMTKYLRWLSTIIS